MENCKNPCNQYEATNEIRKLFSFHHSLIICYGLTIFKQNDVTSHGHDASWSKSRNNDLMAAHQRKTHSVTYNVTRFVPTKDANEARGMFDDVTIGRL